MTNYAALVREMSRQTGLPVSVIEAQVMEESGYNQYAVSNAGAEGWLQFLPSTYVQYGGKPGTEFNPSAEATVYIRFINALKRAEHGNIRDVLAAYNAGPGNLAAGYGYADTILANAGYPGRNAPPRGNIQGNAPVSAISRRAARRAIRRATPQKPVVINNPIRLRGAPVIQIIPNAHDTGAGNFQIASGKMQVSAIEHQQHEAHLAHEAHIAHTGNQPTSKPAPRSAPKPPSNRGTGGIRIVNK